MAIWIAWAFAALLSVGGPFLPPDLGWYEVVWWLAWLPWIYTVVREVRR